MAKETFIDDLFDAARNEPTVRTLDSVEQFIQTTAAGTSTSLIVQWLKQYKMNILISASGVIVATSIFLFQGGNTTENPEVSTTKAHVNQEFEEVSAEAASEPDTENPIRDEPKVVTEEIDEANHEKEGVAKEPVQVAQAPTEPQTSKSSVVTSSVKTQTTPVKPNEGTTSIESIVEEHLIVLESAKGKASAEAFEAYLTNHLKSLDYDFNSSVSKAEIRKFTLKLDNRYKANFQMQVSGFDKLELHWDLNEKGEIINVWYRLDAKEIKELDFSKACKKSVKVKYRHEEF